MFKTRPFFHLFFEPVRFCLCRLAWCLSILRVLMPPRIKRHILDHRKVKSYARLGYVLCGSLHFRSDRPLPGFKCPCNIHAELSIYWKYLNGYPCVYILNPWTMDVHSSILKWGAFDSAKNHKRQRRKRQFVTAKREKSQTPKFV